MSFFDHNATTPLWPVAKAAWNETVETLWMNPSSPYRAAAKVNAHLESAREELGAILGIAPRRVVFNSGATEGNNAVFQHWRQALPADSKIGVGPTEHPSVIEAARRLFGERVVWLPLDNSGVVDLQAIDMNGVAAISMMAANNETGVIHPWRQMAEACRAARILYHCDASQWIGKCEPEGLGTCDYLTGCAHKFGGPRGVGFSVLPEAAISTFGQAGGEQEGGMRAGTPDVAGARAMVAALRRTESLRQSASSCYRDAFVAKLASTLPNLEVVGQGAERLWNTACLILPQFGSVRWIRALEKRGFHVSAGSACSTAKQGPSPALAAMKLPTTSMRRAIRISSGWLAGAADWNALADAVLDSYAVLQSETEDSDSEVISV